MLTTAGGPVCRDTSAGTTRPDSGELEIAGPSFTCRPVDGFRTPLGQAGIGGPLLIVSLSRQ